MEPLDRAKLIAELEPKWDHDILILAAADVAELKNDFKQVCADVNDHAHRLTIIETNWKAFVAIIAAAVVLIPIAVDLILKVA